jgi:hypothetical protein
MGRNETVLRPVRASRMSRSQFRPDVCRRVVPHPRARPDELHRSSLGTELCFHIQKRSGIFKKEIRLARAQSPEGSRLGRQSAVQPDRCDESPEPSSAFRHFENLGQQLSEMILRDRGLAGIKAF